MPNRVVIIEGPDGSGKTTMAKYLEQHHGFRYVHNGPPPENEDPLVYYGHMLYEASRAGQPIVFDRAHIGQAVYGPILRDDHRFGYEAVRLCNRITNAYAMSVIIALPPYKAAYTNWKNRKGELFQNDDKFNMVYDRFKDLKDLFAYGHYDYTRDGEKLPQLVDLLVAMQRTDGWLAHGVIGSPTAKFLFVGDAPNQETLDLPFFALNASALNEGSRHSPLAGVAWPRSRRAAPCRITANWSLASCWRGRIRAW